MTSFDDLWLCCEALVESDKRASLQLKWPQIVEDNCQPREKYPGRCVSPRLSLWNRIIFSDGRIGLDFVRPTGEDALDCLDPLLRGIPKRSRILSSAGKPHTDRHTGEGESYISGARLRLPFRTLLVPLGFKEPDGASVSPDVHVMILRGRGIMRVIFSSDWTQRTILRSLELYETPCPRPAVRIRRRTSHVFAYDSVQVPRCQEQARIEDHLRPAKARWSFFGTFCGWWQRLCQRVEGLKARWS